MGRLVQGTAAFALFPKDISQPPREWAERFFNVQRWTEMPRGGHFAAMEEPELLAEDIREWFRGFRDPSRRLIRSQARPKPRPCRWERARVQYRPPRTVGQ